MPPDPLEARASGPSVYRYTRLLYHENPPTSKFNETPAMFEIALKCIANPWAGIQPNV